MYKNHQNQRGTSPNTERMCRIRNLVFHRCCLCQIYLMHLCLIGIFRKLQVANLSLGVWNLTIVAEKMLITSGSYAPPSCPRICIRNEWRFVPKLRRSKEMKSRSSKGWLLSLKLFSMCRNPKIGQEGSSGFTGWGLHLCREPYNKGHRFMSHTKS